MKNKQIEKEGIELLLFADYDYIENYKKWTKYFRIIEFSETAR